MIVQCTTCNARFRVADEKVPERGVKVRCTKCATVFKVTRADAVDNRAPPGRDPFGLDANEGSPSQRREQTQRDPPPYGDQSHEDSGGGAHGQNSGGNRVVPHMPPSVSLTYGAASPHQSLDLELSLGPPAAPPGLPPMPTPSYMNASLPMSPSPARMPVQHLSGNAIDAALDAAMASGDGFNFDVGGQTPLLYAQPPPTPQPLAFAPNSARRSQPPPSRSAIDPFSVSDERDNGGGGDVDPFALDDAPPPAPPPPSPRTTSTGFQPVALPRTTSTGMQPVASPRTTSTGLQPVMPQRSSPPPARPADPWVGLLSKPAKEETDPFAGLDTGSEIAAPPAPEPRSTPPVPSQPPQREEAPAPPKPPVSPPAGMVTVPASIREIEFTEATQGHKLDLDYGNVAEPGVGGDSTFDKKDSDKEKVDRAKIRSTRDTGGGVELGRIGLVPRSVAQEEEKPKADPKTAVKSRLRREVAAALFNVGSAAVVFYAGLIAIAALRAPRPISLDDVGFPIVWLAMGSGGGTPADQLRVVKVHSGIYPIHTGEELFYVEGLAQNDSGGRRDGLYVTLELVRLGHVIEHVDALAGLNSTPEDLYGLSGRKNDDLQRILLQQSPKLSVEAHESAPFIGIFKATAKEVEGSDIRATVHDGIPASLKSLVTPSAKGATEGAAPEKGAAPPPIAKGANEEDTAEAAKTP